MGKYIILNSYAAYRKYNDYQDYKVKIDYAVGLKQNYAALALIKGNQTLWMEKLVEVTDPFLMPRVSPWVLNEYVLVWTEGEHPRGATLHEQKFHCLSAKTGDLLWSRAWNIQSKCVLSGDKLYIVQDIMQNAYKYEPRLLDALEIKIKTGIETKRIPVLISLNKLEEAKAAKWGNWTLKNTVFQKEGKQLLLCSQRDCFEPIVLA